MKTFHSIIDRLKDTLTQADIIDPVSLIKDIDPPSARDQAKLVWIDRGRKPNHRRSSYKKAKVVAL